MYYEDGINMVIINDSVKYDTYLEIRLPLFGWENARIRFKMIICSLWTMFV